MKFKNIRDKEKIQKVSREDKKYWSLTEEWEIRLLNSYTDARRQKSKVLQIPIFNLEFDI